MAVLWDGDDPDTAAYAADMRERAQALGLEIAGRSSVGSGLPGASTAWRGAWPRPGPTPSSWRAPALRTSTRFSTTSVHVSVEAWR